MASNSEIRIFKLNHSSADDVAKAINDLFGKVYTRAPGGGPQPGQPGQPMPQPQGQPGPAGAAQQARSAIVAEADIRTNSVIVVAAGDNMAKVATLIQSLDDPEATALETYIRKLQFADATDVADTINSIMSGTAPTRAGQTQGASFQQRVFGFGGPFGGIGGGNQGSQGFTQSTDPFAKVVPNARTNSLYITATKERMAKIDDLIQKLDVPIKTETTTFVIPLKNAQASDLAYILGEAFGTGNTQNSNPYGFFFGGYGGFGRQGQQNQKIQRRQGQSSNSPFGRAAVRGQSGGVIPDAPSDAGGVHGTLTQQGFLPDGTAEGEATARAAAAGGGGQFFGYGYRQNNQMQTPSYGRGQRGDYVNYLQLRNNVGVVAEPGTNSLVITTNPENMPALQEIIASLDSRPRQVMIEVIIAEATIDAANKLGFQFDTSGIGRIFGSAVNQSLFSNFPLTAGSTSQNIAAPINPGTQFGVQSPGGRFNALIQALASNDKVKILSTPKVFTSNNQEAEVRITQQVQIPTGSFSGGFAGGTTIGYAPQDVGISLDVTPRITQDGLVTIDVYATASELVGFDTLTSSIDANGRVTSIQSPRVAQRSTDTSVSVKDGEIVALGGLMRENATTNVSKIPILGDIPIIGNLFKSTSHTTEKTELMVFMIPHVVDGDKSARAMTGSESKNIIREFPELKQQQPQLDPKTQTPLPDQGRGTAPAPQPQPQSPQTGPRENP